MIELSPCVLKTFRVLASLGTASVPQIYKALDEPDVHVTAINQRVHDLLELNLVKRVKAVGNSYRYSVQK